MRGYWKCGEGDGCSGVGCGGGGDNVLNVVLMSVMQFSFPRVYFPTNPIRFLFKP